MFRAVEIHYKAGVGRVDDGLELEEAPGLCAALQSIRLTDEALHARIHPINHDIDTSGYATVRVTSFCLVL